MNKLSDDLPGGKNVCAIILDYFGADKTVACLRSLLDQELDSVLVVDNSGTGKPASNFKMRWQKLLIVKSLSKFILWSIRKTWALVPA